MKPSDYIKRGWTQFSLAKGFDGINISPFSDFAVCWCTVGAIAATCPGDSDKQLSIEINLALHLGIDNITWWNDTPGRTQAEVIAALEAIGE